MVSAKEQEIFERRGVFEAVLRLALPTVAGQIILVIYNMADTFFVGLAGSAAMLTAVTVCMPGFMVLSAIANLFGIGGGSVMARALGNGDMERGKKAASFAFWGCLAVCLGYSFLMFLVRHGAVDLLGGSHPKVHPPAVEYLTVTVCLGGAATGMSMLLSHLLRSQGRSLAAGAGIALGGVMNITLDPLFMFYLLPPGREALGAAIATALSNGIALVFLALAVAFPGKKPRLRFPIQQAAGGDGVIKAVLISGAPACMMTLMENASYAVLDKLMSFHGVHAQAAVGVAKKVNMLAHCLVRGIAQGALPLIAYNYGAGKLERMSRAFRCACTLAVGAALVCMTASLIFARDLVGLFIRSQPDAERLAVLFLRILCVGGPFSALAYTVISFFQAVGKGPHSVALALLRKGLVDIPLMFLLGAGMPMTGLVLATPLTDVVCSAAAGTMFIHSLKKWFPPEVDPAAEPGRNEEEDTNDGHKTALPAAGDRDRQLHQGGGEPVADPAGGKPAHPPAGGGVRGKAL